MKKLVRIMIFNLLCVLLFCGCDAAGNSKEYSADFFAMDTYMKLSAYGNRAKEAVEASQEEILALEQLLSTNIPTSEVAMLNENGSGEVSFETAYLIQKSIEYYRDTDGAYDITVYPCVYEWGFITKDFKVPSESRMEELLPLIGSDKISLKGFLEDEADASKKYEVTLEKEGMMLDLGTIAKGYASQRVSEIFKEYGIESGLINLGGNVQLVGAKPDKDAWKVAIQKPEKDASDTAYVGTLLASDCAITTAGGYERYFEEDGVTYRHIFDPSTGRPTESSLKSVTVVAQSGVDADGYDTALFVMDLEKAIEFWKSHRDEFDVIIVAKDDKIYVSEGIYDSFTPFEKLYEVIEIE